MNHFVLHEDPILATIITQVELPVISSTQDVFHDLMSCIIEQQIHYRSTKKIFQRALERADIERVTLENFHFLEERGLSQLKLSMGKYETLMALVEYWNRNTLDFHQLSDDAVRKELSSLKGIGNWSIDMILLYTLGRPTIFPVDDFHLKQIMIELYQLDPQVKLKAQMQEIADRWGEQKSAAVLYLLAWKRSSKKQSAKN